MKIPCNPKEPARYPNPPYFILDFTTVDAHNPKAILVDKDGNLVQAYLDDITATGPDETQNQLQELVNYAYDILDLIRHKS